MDFLNVYTTDIWQTPSDYYHDFAQATIDSVWEDTTQIRKIKEQSYPFSNTYTEYESHITTVSEFSVNTTKVSGDYIKVLFKDIDHALNHRGQKYLYAPDGVSENVYLCYDKLNPLTQVPDFKAIRCNNHLTILKSDGSIVKEPCFIGYEITGTNNNITKDATVPQRRIVMMVQGNENTEDIKLNQRFIFQHKQAYKITEMNTLNQEDYNDENVTLYTFYIEWSSILPSDNTALNLADYYDRVYTLSINSTNLSLLPLSSGQLSATVKLNDVIQSDVPLKWATSNENVIEIDALGNYQVVGLSGSTARITCYIDGNDNVYDSIDISVTATPIINKEIRINPSIPTKILQGSYLDVSYGVYDGDVLTSDVVTITPSGVSSSNYTLTYSSGKVKVSNLLKSTNKLTLTFSSGSLTDKTLELTLGGII